VGILAFYFEVWLRQRAHGLLPPGHSVAAVFVRLPRLVFMAPFRSVRAGIDVGSWY